MPSTFTLLLPMIALQVGPSPTFGDLPDYSAEVQDRPPRETVVPERDPAGLLESADYGWLSTCLEQVQTAPARAHVQAQVRRDQTEGSERVIANYCLGMASAELRRWDDAITALIAARDGAGDADRRMKARFGAMAGNAALASGNTERGLALLQQAQFDGEAAGFGPLAATAAIDRAFVLVAQADNDLALSALADARRLHPQSSKAWLLSATLMRRLERLGEARGMIEQALDLDTSDPDIALEAGVIAVLGGRDENARQYWNTVTAIAPDTPQGETARDYLAQLGEAVPTP